MNVSQLNGLLAQGIIDQDGMWPRLKDYESSLHPFVFEFGLTKIPNDPGLLVVRGPRQYGKSTWLDLQIRNTIREFGKGTAFYLNGDELLDGEVLFEELLSLENSFPKDAIVQRIFIDEITAVENWERAIKRAFDQGHLRKTLLITTGSKALDLLRGHERLPGRKGRLSQTEYIFLPISYSQFFKACGKDIGSDSWKAYLLAGGAPLACNEIIQQKKIPEYFVQMIQDWILGDIASLGRNRLHLKNILNTLYRFTGQPVGFAKLARETGLANNTVASGYIEQLGDLLTVLPVWNWDIDRSQPLFRKPCKFTFINLAVATCFHSSAFRSVNEFNQLPAPEQGKLLEWLVAQELWRKDIIKGNRAPEGIGYWQSKCNEIDFVVNGEEFFEVKLGQASALEFSWFAKVFPKKQLTVICNTPFTGKNVRGITVHQFLTE